MLSITFSCRQWRVTSNKKICELRYSRLEQNPTNVEWQQHQVQWCFSTPCVAFNIEKLQRLQGGQGWTSCAGKIQMKVEIVLRKGSTPPALLWTGLACNGLRWILLGIALLDREGKFKKMDGSDERSICCCRSNCYTRIAAPSSLNGKGWKVFGEYQALETPFKRE